MDTQQEHSLFDMQMDDSSQQSLLSVSKWAKFIAVSGIIIGAIALIFALAYGPQIIQVFTTMLKIGVSQEEAGMLIGVLVVVVLLICGWLYFLLRSASLLNRGLESRSSALLAEGFRSMRVYFVISFIISLLSIISVITEMI
ncbi:MAG: hypothetical protein IPP99_22615 [Chitinophagaceae bacterium]|nr:hypothetical protein [Chitinophagaceae bacterium]